ncbi:NAD(P)H dehydrogenase (quinone) [Microlunatus endophyticus]|uniref:NAD(P)H dehydrogenase (Quinone) n=2 Tax=Microlunatus endophyticus TaxID=1716077 RepID=A0A917W7Z0_9ACTN|nr:NAD(P)H dehydrogenase (quinone) [Microlunatus endophyticus]
MIVLAHPSAAGFDHELADRVRSVIGQTGVRQHFHDLYAESFDPVLTENAQGEAEVWSRGTSAEQVRARVAAAPDPLVLRHQRELAEARGLVVIHPDWLGKPPAILAGWLDRVLLSARQNPAPQLQRALVINTCEADGTAAESDALGVLWRDQLGPYLGSPLFERLTFRGVGTADDQQLGRWRNATDRAAAWVSGAAR